MGRRIRVPWLVDLVLVADPPEIRALAEEPRLDRRFLRRGPLFNRLVAQRIRHWFQVDGVPLPSLAPRGDAARAEQQRQLAAQLCPSVGRRLWTEQQLARLVLFVTGRADREEAGVAAQELVGRLFYSDYLADRASWDAAQAIDDFRDGFSPRHLVWMLTGRLRRARELLLQRARQDRHALHGTAIGVHGIVDALERMRALYAAPGRASLSDEAVLGQCLFPPRRVPRTVEAGFSTPATAGRLGPGVIVMFELEPAASRAPGAEMVFMHGHWNACPAEVFVTELLRAVWKAA
jgi:hypothetical protein